MYHKVRTTVFSLPAAIGGVRLANTKATHSLQKGVSVVLQPTLQAKRVADKIILGDNIIAWK